MEKKIKKLELVKKTITELTAKEVKQLKGGCAYPSSINTKFTEISSCCNRG